MMGDICRGCLHLSTVHQLHSNYSPECRAGHPTILLRQRDHVSRPHRSYLLQYYWIYLATPSRHLDLDIFRICSCPRGSITLSRCCVVVVAKLKNCRVPSSALKNWNLVSSTYTVLFTAGACLFWTSSKVGKSSRLMTWGTCDSSCNKQWYHCRE